MSDIRQAMHSGELYDPLDPDLFQEQMDRMELLYDFNATRPSQGERRQELMRRMFAEVGDNCWIEPPLHASWSGKFVHLGNSVYANFNLTLVDDTHIFIGDHTMIGPGVTLCTAGHPVHPALRHAGMQFNMPVTIGKNVWLGAGVTVLPGVTIGDNTVIGAGSLVTKDIPANSVAYGSPCRVIRQIDERDRNTYFRGRPIPEAMKKQYG